MKAKILVIDDDPKLNRLLSDYLGGQDYKVYSALLPSEGISLLKRETPDLLVLDVMMPEKDGFEVCKELRAQGQSLPILMLTARGDVTDRVVGLEIGADDYLPKPFEPRELLARVQALLRRGPLQQGEELLEHGPLKIDGRRREASLKGKVLDLTGMDFDSLALFVRNAGRVLSRDPISARVRGLEHESFDRSVDVALSRLRQKLGDDPQSPEWFKTVRGQGYQLMGSE